MIENKRLIAEIKKRRALWDPTYPDYKNSSMKAKLWEEICATLLTDFVELSISEKDVVVYDFRQKWRNIRDCYMRNLRLKATSTKNVKDYIYAPRLKFLDKITEYRPAGTENDGDRQSNDGDDTNDDGNDHGNDDGNDHGNGDGGVSIDDADVDDPSPVGIQDENVEAEQSSNHAASASINNEDRNQNFESEQSSDHTARRDERAEVERSPRRSVSAFQRGNDEKRKIQTAQSRIVKSQPRVAKSVQLLNYGDSYHQDNCDDMDFFRSLLPLVTSLPLNQKIRFRMDVMRIALQYHENTRSPTMAPSCYFPASTNPINSNFQPYPPSQNFPNMHYNAYQPYFQNNQSNIMPVQPTNSYPNVRRNSKKRSSDLPQGKSRSSLKKSPVRSRSPAKKAKSLQSKGEGRNAVRTPIYSHSDSSCTSVMSDSNSNMEKNCE